MAVCVKSVVFVIVIVAVVLVVQVFVTDAGWVLSSINFIWGGLTYCPYNWALSAVYF